LTSPPAGFSIGAWPEHEEGRVPRALLAPALVGVLLATPARGADDGLKLSGTGEFNANYVHFTEKTPAVIQPEEASNLWTVGGAGALDAALGVWHLQADFSGEGTVHNRSADDTYQGSLGGGLHAGWRDPELGSLGVFGSMSQLTINDRGNADPRFYAWMAGGEYQLFLGPGTLFVQSGFLQRESPSQGGDDGAIKDAGFVRMGGRYFWGDDLKLEVEGSYAKGKMDPDLDNVVIWDWGAEIEYRLPGTPLAGFLEYTGAHHFEDDDNDKLLETRIGFGVRVYLGQPSLKANDRQGASFDLPRYVQWNGVTAGTLE
jgi:hypothetical protein